MQARGVQRLHDRPYARTVRRRTLVPVRMQSGVGPPGSGGMQGKRVDRGL